MYETLLAEIAPQNRLFPLCKRGRHYQRAQARRGRVWPRSSRRPGTDQTWAGHETGPAFGGRPRAVPRVRRCHEARRAADTGSVEMRRRDPHRHGAMLIFFGGGRAADAPSSPLHRAVRAGVVSGADHSAQGVHPDSDDSDGAGHRSRTASVGTRAVTLGVPLTYSVVLTQCGPGVLASGACVAVGGGGAFRTPAPGDAAQEGDNTYAAVPVVPVGHDAAGALRRVRATRQQGSWRCSRRGRAGSSQCA